MAELLKIVNAVFYDGMPSCYGKLEKEKLEVEGDSNRFVDFEIFKGIL